MTEADVRFLEALETDLAHRLGPRLSIVELSLDRPADGRVRITVTTEASGASRSFSEEGDSLTAVAATLLDRSAEVRLAEGFREVVGGAFV
jgi:hypothetical protein